MHSSARMDSQVATALSNNDKERLVQNLLGARRLGRPPFLIRNLLYVKDHRRELQKRLWDFEWAGSRSSAAGRKLGLHCLPLRCVLPDVIHQRFKPKQGKEPKEEDNAHFAQARARIWLAVETGVGESLAFSVRETSVRLWPRSFVAGGGVIDDFTAEQVFDLSAIHSFLDAFTAKVSVVLELHPLKPSLGKLSTAVANAESPALRGELVLIDKYASTTSTVLNGEFRVRLHQVNMKALKEAQPSMGLANASNGDPGKTTDNKMLGTQVASNSVNDMEIDNMEQNEGMITLKLKGSLESHKDVCTPIQPKEILVECVYKSPKFPWWNGIVRHDFICPWCHRNCRRLRTLLLHFHLDHDHSELSLEALRKPASDGVEHSEAPFVLHLNVTPVQPKPARGMEETEREHVMVNSERFPKYNPAPPANGVAELDMSKCRVAEEDDEDDDAESISTIEEEPPITGSDLRNCENPKCLRKHNGSYQANTRYCSEWCDVLCSQMGYRADDDGANSASDDLPLSRLAIQRKKRIDFKKAFGDKTLYHVVSLVPFLESHFDEDGSDSEDEIDHSWRHRIVEDKLATLEGVDPKSRVLWIMWNKYAHENYPAPGAYAERYTRYSVERFVLEYGSEIKRLKLRLQLCALLRVMHIHGSIDSKAWLSIMQCLDGKKRLKDISVSARPEKATVQDPKIKKRRNKKPSY